MDRALTDLQPTAFDGLFGVSEIVQHLTTTATSDAPKLPARYVNHSLNDEYSDQIKGYLGEDGMKYEIELPLASPSEYHCRVKAWNIQIVLDNVADMANNDLLPRTEREKELWENYSQMKMRLFAMPFAVSFPVMYIGCRQIQSRLRVHKGRSLPIWLALGFAEQWYENKFPAYMLLNEALSARTALGDAARADWQRMQPVTVSYRDRFWYRYSRFLGQSYNGYQFGGTPDVT